MKKILLALLFLALGAGARAQSLADAQRAIEIENFDQAKTILQKLVAANPTDGQYLFYLGDVYLMTGEDKLARESFNQSATLKKNAQFGLIGQGHILLNDGKPQEAAALFDQAMQKVGKKDITERLYIARAYMQTFNPDFQKAADFAGKVVEIDPNSAQGQLTLGDAMFNLGNMNDAYAAYRTAFNLDNSLLRAKLHLAVITKNAQAFPEAVQALNEIIALDANYAPAYRERAEVYYLWAIMDGSVYDEYIPKALADYRKYKELIGSSLDARMRYADFLILAKDYKSLETEAAEMQKIDNVNPRILRYLGYSAFENGHYEEAAKALETFISTVDQRRLLWSDYSYLARAYARIMIGREMPPVDTVMLRKVISNMHSAIELKKTAIDKDAQLDPDFRELAVKMYKVKEYINASEIFGVLAGLHNSSLNDQFYFANSIFFHIVGIARDLADKENEKNAAIARYMPKIQVADTVYAAIIRDSPTTLDAFYNRAALSRLTPGSDAAKVAQMFQAYIDAATAKGDEELAKTATRAKLSDAYSTIGAFHLGTDDVKAKEYFTKALEFNPNNGQAAAGVEFLTPKTKKAAGG